MKLASGEVVSTTTGRDTTPFPKVDLTSDRRTVNTEKRVIAWLMGNAVEEARARNDSFNLRTFEQCRERPSQSDRDAAESYLFDPDWKDLGSADLPLRDLRGTP